MLQVLLVFVVEFFFMAVSAAILISARCRNCGSLSSDLPAGIPRCMRSSPTRIHVRVGSRKITVDIDTPAEAGQSHGASSSTDDQGSNEVLQAPGAQWLQNSVEQRFAARRIARRRRQRQRSENGRCCCQDPGAGGPPSKENRWTPEPRHKSCCR